MGHFQKCAKRRWRTMFQWKFPNKNPKQFILREIKWLETVAAAKWRSRIHFDETLNQRKCASSCGQPCHLQVPGFKDEACLQLHLNELIAAHQSIYCYSDRRNNVSHAGGTNSIYIKRSQMANNVDYTSDILAFNFWCAPLNTSLGLFPGLIGYFWSHIKQPNHHWSGHRMSSSDIILTPLVILFELDYSTPTFLFIALLLLWFCDLQSPICITEEISCKLHLLLHQLLVLLPLPSRKIKTTFQVFTTQRLMPAVLNMQNCSGIPGVSKLA